VFEAKVDWRRLAYVGLAAYAGGLFGLIALTGWRVELHDTNPIVVLSALIGAVIVPGANLALGVLVLLSCLFVIRRIPLWTIGLSFAGFPVTAYYAMNAWIEH
jgi:hypothetical protein